MNSATINHVSSFMQDRQEGRFTMQGLALTNLIHNVIREYGQYDGCDYTVLLSDIDNTDRKLFISHLCSAEDYEVAASSPEFLDELWEENSKHIDKLISNESFYVYKEDMEEMGMSMQRHLDNEPDWIRR